jgi:hypothetical protein
MVSSYNFPQASTLVKIEKLLIAKKFDSDMYMSMHGDEVEK